MAFLIATCNISVALVQNLVEEWQPLNELVKHFRNAMNRKFKTKFWDLIDVHSKCEQLSILLNLRNHLFVLIQFTFSQIGI